MSSRSLFLLKTIGYSLLFFCLWSPLSRLYGAVLNGVLQFFYPAPILIEKWPYTASLFLIPLISLVLATPNVKKTKKGIMIGTGIAISLFLDLVKIKFGIGDNGQLLAAYSVYHCLKWLSPLLVWVLFCSDRLECIFSPSHETDQNGCFSCPLCSEKHVDILRHIQVIHGPKSFKIKKVKRFMANNPQV